MEQKEYKYNAKSANSLHAEISNQEHLQKVALLAGAFGAEIGKAEAAELAGGVHDFGKYAERFQGVLRGTHQGGGPCNARRGGAVPAAEFEGRMEKLLGGRLRGGSGRGTP